MVSIEQSGVTTVDTMLVPALLVSVVANVVMGGQVYTETDRQVEKGITKETESDSGQVYTETDKTASIY